MGSTIHAEDTRERLEEDIKSTQWCVSLKDVLGWLDRQEAITERNCRAEYDDMRDYLQAQVDELQGLLDAAKTSADIRLGLARQRAKEVDRLEEKVDALESENNRLKVKVSNQRRELDTYQIMYDVEAVAQLKREKKRYKGMYNAEHQMACSQRRKIDRLTEENEAMRQALMDLRGILG